jgi:hypothetical protein
MYSTLTSLGDAQHSLYGLVKDPAPDSYSFVVSSFAQFAPESPEQASAMEILNAAISQVRILIASQICEVVVCLVCC